MKLLTLKFLFLIIYLISSNTAYSSNELNIKNLIIHPKSKKIEDIEFKDVNNNIVNIKDLRNRLILINFWATWCAPCLEEMPSLNKLQANKKFKTLKIFPINVGRENLDKSINFFDKLKIDNLNIYYDSTNKLPDKFSLRGLPTTILINKNGEEFGRMIGYVDFENENFIEWLKKFDN